MPDPIFDLGSGATDPPSDAEKAQVLSALGAARSIETKTTSFTAVVGGRYIVEGTATITDPAGTAVGDSYEVWIGSGTATIGGTAYSPSRFSIRRRVTSIGPVVWATPAPMLTDALDIAAAARATTRTNLGLGAGDSVTFDNLTIASILTVGTNATPANNASLARDGTGLLLINPTNSRGAQCYGPLSTRGAFFVFPQALSGNGAVTAVNTTTVTTTIANTGTANTTTTLAAGTDGQIKTICFITDGGFDAVITVTNPGWGGAGTITMGDAGDSIMLQYLGAKWQVLSNNGSTLA